jgi:diketogulonate reductase-like aldo/keto reductase
VALAFLLRHPCVLTIPKAARVEHVVELAGAGEMTLRDDEVRRLEAAFPAPPGRSPLPTL